MSFQAMITYAFYSLSLQMFQGRAVMNRSAFYARPSEVKSCPLAQERTSGASLCYFPTLIYHAIYF